MTVLLICKTLVYISYWLNYPHVTTTVLEDQTNITITFECQILVFKLTKIYS